ncbi:hypothetical protein B0H17DRAFT_1123756 [Mycena rosella]|uniref:Uncharacterized protein n=1 Tax=Mycena rosella TaxID=1033263 RepID=A0AAD7MCF8_MYCRO|nr:hypothetical protein B0H17DRAFT_1123756 [Mycena rosella]
MTSFPALGDHENPALVATFIEAIPQVVEILHAFQHTHPIIDHFDKYFANKPVQARRQKLAEWMAAFCLVSTPELDAVLQPVLEVLLIHAHLAHLPESDRNERVMGTVTKTLCVIDRSQSTWSAFNRPDRRIKPNGAWYEFSPPKRKSPLSTSHEGLNLTHKDFENSIETESSG